MGTLVPFSSAQTQGTLAGGLARPFDATGELLAPSGRPRNRTAVWAAAGEQLTAQVKQLCSWRADRRDIDWRIGDYSFLVIEFDTGHGATPFLQFWSEPCDPRVRFEVCSGANDAALERHMGRRREEDLRDRGFEIGGNAGNFGKHVVVDTPAAAAALAREAVGLLCRVLGYDGQPSLRFHLHLGSRLEVKPVHTGIDENHLASLLGQWGCKAERHLDPASGRPMPDYLHCEYAGYTFSVLFFQGACQDPTQRGVLCFRRYLVDKSLPLAAIANQVGQGLLGVQASIDTEGDLQFDQTVLLDGGITVENLRSQLMLWKANMDRIGVLIEKAG